MILVECSHCGGDFEEGDGKGSLKTHMAAVKAIETREKGGEPIPVDIVGGKMIKRADPIINERIIKKIEELTKDKNERIICRKILVEENLYRKDEGHDFKVPLRRWIQDLFPYEPTEGD